MMYHIYRKTVKSGSKMVQRWYYWFKDAEGKQISRVCKDCRTKQQALLYISQLPADQKSGRFLVKDIAQNMFVKDSEYYNVRRNLGKKFSSRTLELYSARLKNVLDDFGNCDLRELTLKKIIDILAKKNTSASWKNQYIHVLREIFFFANYNGAKIYEPKFPVFSGSVKKSDVFTMKEIKAIFSEKNFLDESFYLLFLLIFSTGLRSGEARAFRPSQLYNERPAIIVNGFLSKNLERQNFNKTGSDENLKWRVLPLPNPVYSKLKAYVEKTKCESDSLLFTFNNEAISDYKALYEFRRAIKKAGVKPEGRKLTCHSLRYTYVTYLRSFLPGEDVQKFVGHSTIQMTDYYTRASLDAAIMQMPERYGVVDKFFTELTDNKLKP